jgi:hypothetical protein
MTQITAVLPQAPRHVHIPMAVVCLLGMALFTSVAFTNLAVLGLVLLDPFAWRDYFKAKQVTDPDARLFLGLVLALCVWDVCTNLLNSFERAAA